MTSRWLVPLSFLPITIAFYRELALPTRILADYDVWTYFYPLRAYAARAIAEGRFPLWNPDIFLGAPFFANPQTSLLYPGTVLFYVLPIPYAYSLSVILHVCLTAVFTFAFLRVTFAVGPLAAALGASAFAFGGFVSSEVGHLNQLSATAWLPLIALAADRALRRGSLRWAVGAAVALAVQLLAGHAQQSYMTLWVLAVLLGWRAGTANRQSAILPPSLTLPRKGGGDRLRNLGRAAGLALGITTLGFGLAAVQVVPTAELAGESIRGGGLSYNEATSFSLIPPLLARSLLPGYWHNVFSEFLGYVGGVGLTLAALGLLAGRAAPTACAAVLAVLGLFLAAGEANPLYPLLFEVVPGLDLFRVPARWLLVYSFGAAALAALGLDWALDPARPRTSSARMKWVGLAMLLLAALALPSLEDTPRRIIALWIATMGAGAFVALIAVRWPRRPWVAGLALSVALADLWLAAIDLPQRHAVPAEVFTAIRPTVQRVLDARGGGRVLSIAPTEYESEDHAEITASHPGLSTAALFALTSAIKLDEVMSPNVPLRYGISTVDGYDGGVLPLRRYLDLASLLVPREELRSDGVLRTRLIAVPEQRWLDLLNIRTVIAHSVVDVELEGVRYDVATARTLQPGDSLQLPLERPAPAVAIGLLASSATDAPRGSEMGRITVVRLDGSRQEVPLRLAQEVFREEQPGAVNVPQPTAGLDRGGRRDSAVRIALGPGSPVTSLEGHWNGPGIWNLRAVTLVSADGRQDRLVLQSGLYRTEVGGAKLYDRALSSPDLKTIARAEVGDDHRALSFLRSAGGQTLSRTIVLAPRGSGQSTANDPTGPESVFRRTGGPPERIGYERVSGDGAGYLVIDDAWYPGWRAEIDGTEAPVERANLFFKAVWVAPGSSRVVLVYDPGSVRLGAALSGAAMVVAVVLWLRGSGLRLSGG